MAALGGVGLSVYSAITTTLTVGSLIAGFVGIVGLENDVLIPSWVKMREIVWWKYKDGDRVLCRVSMIGQENVTITILHATPEQILSIRRGCGELVLIQYAEGLLELAR